MSAISSINFASSLTVFKNYTASSASISFQKNESTVNSKEVESLTPEEEMARFKQEIYRDIEKIQSHSSVKNVAINISDEAFVRMKDDPQYRKEVYSLLKRDLESSYSPRNTSVILTVGETLDDYRGDSWPESNDTEFWGRSHDSFYKKTAEDSVEKRKERMEEYLRLLRGESYFNRFNVFVDIKELPIRVDDGFVEGLTYNGSAI